MMERSEEAWLISGETIRAFDIVPSLPEISGDHAWKVAVERWGAALDPGRAAMTIGSLAQSVGLVGLSNRIYNVAIRVVSEPSRIQIDLRRDYLLSVAGRYATRERHLARMENRWCDKAGRGELSRVLLRLTIRRLLAECKAFDDRVISAFLRWLRVWISLRLLTLRTPARDPLRGQILMELALCRNDLLFILRIPGWRWMFSWYGPVIIVVIQTLSRAIALLPGALPGLTDQVRTRRHSGVEPLDPLLGTAAAYWELENLLGLTNVLREVALKELNRIRLKLESNRATARLMLTQSYRISKLIGDRPGMAKALFAMSWLTMKFGTPTALGRIKRCTEDAMTRVEALHWRRHCLRQLRRWQACDGAFNSATDA